MPQFPSPFDISVVDRLLSEQPLIFADVGAAGGIDPFLRRFDGGDLTRFFGFEPNPAEFEKLVPRRNVQYFPYAISDRSGEVDFFVRGTMSSIERRPMAENAQPLKVISVPVRTLAQLVDNGTLPGLDAVKVDAEGHDFLVLRGVDNRLANEVLMVKTEFSFGSRSPGSQFSKIDKLLTGCGMLLFGMQYYCSPIGELNSGDAVYLRSVESILQSDASSEFKRSRILKLICLCHYIRNLDYAYIVARAACYRGILTDEEGISISTALQKSLYLPAIIPGARWTDLIIQFMFIIQVLLAGSRWRNKSLPKPNRLDRYGILSIPTSLVGRRRAKKHLEEMYEDYRQRIPPAPVSKDEQGVLLSRTEKL